MQTDLLLLAPVGISLALYALQLGLAIPTLRRPPRPLALARAPRVSILKPVAGVDDELASNLASFAALDYPSFELLLGVSSYDDPSVPVLREFLAANPALDDRLIRTDPAAATNPKVAQLIGLERAATGQVLVISDANVRVGADYLFHLVEGLAEDGVGLVTSVIAGTGERSVGAALENLHLAAFIAPSVVSVSRLAPARPLAVGKSMAMRRRDLAKLGGFACVRHVLAEDYMLAQRFVAAGHRVRLSLARVENRNVTCSVRKTVDRHTRWTQMRRVLSPGAFAFEPLLTPFVVAGGAFVVAPRRELAIALALTALVQIVGAQLALRAVRGRGLHWTWAPLELGRSVMMLVCWLRSWASLRVQWRGHPFRLGAGSTITPIRAGRAPLEQTASSSARA